MKKRTVGFTLIEVMIVVVVVGILAAIAYPSYAQYVQKSRRTDATTTLLTAAQQLERCYSQNFKYADCTGLPSASPEGYYTITAELKDASYTLTATAIGVQARDTACPTFTLTNTGQRTPASGQCWAR